MIKLTFESVDHCRERKQFKLLRGARKYAQERVGKHPEVASLYAVSGDGIGKIHEVSGCKLADLFGDEPEEEDRHRQRTQFQCNFCNHRFRRILVGSTVEVKCPKCREVDVFPV